MKSKGQNSSASGACSVATTASTVACDSDDAMACTDKGGICAFQALIDCSVIPTTKENGVCWILPAACPDSDDETAQSCVGAQSCVSECAVIKAKHRYMLPLTCH
jgi:hypothetical protein